ncbi:MAG: T9SS type A sorting domain-containing protein, partial [Ignavibacteria bacterium]
VITGGSTLDCITILGPNDIYAGGLKSVGAPGPSQGTLVMHWNGSSWNIEDTPNQSDNRTNRITNMKALNSNDIWAVGYSRRLTENFKAMVLHKSGSSWSIVPVPQPGDENFLYSIDIISSVDIWASGYYNDGGTLHSLFLHYDGSSWTVVTSPGGGFGTKHNSSSDIWSTGSEFVHYEGSTWSLVSADIPAGGSMGSTTRISSTDMWAVGRSDDGSIFKTLTMHYGNPTVILNPSSTIQNYELSQNYPNPFNPETTIKFSIPNSSKVILKIYSNSGEELEEILNENLKAGTHEFKWSAVHLPSGVYYYEIHAGEFTETKKMLLIK